METGYYYDMNYNCVGSVLRLTAACYLFSTMHFGAKRV